MTSLGELREALDKIDNEIAELYEKRMEVCRKVGEYKVKSGKKVFDRQREKEKRKPGRELKRNMQMIMSADCPAIKEV